MIIPEGQGFKRICKCCGQFIPLKDIVLKEDFLNEWHTTKEIAMQYDCSIQHVTRELSLLEALGQLSKHYDNQSNNTIWRKSKGVLKK